jgi:peroxisomal trans-2-enoyl-CoA reductase
VLIASRSEETLQAALPELEAIAAASGGSVVHVAGSIKDEDGAKMIVRTAIETFGRLDYLVNNGGGQFEQAAADMALKGWTAVIETNLTGPWLMSTLAYNMWMRDHGGSIVVITAAPHDRQGDPGMSHTAAARAGADNLCKTLSVEWAASQVRVNAVAPGSIFSETAEANYTDRADFADASPTGPKAGKHTPARVVRHRLKI